MALWYDMGTGFGRAPLARADLGLPVMLCAPGPSLKRIERGPGFVLAALTKAYPVIEPDIWFGMDDPLCYDPRLWWTGFMKVARSGLQDLDISGRTLRSFPMTYFADCKPCAIADIFAARRLDTKFIWLKHTLGVALHGLVWMGARRIFLNGFDQGGHADWHDGPALPPDLKAINRRLYAKQTTFLREFALAAAGHGIELISVTPGSPINAFLPYVEFDEVMRQARAALPPAAIPLHCVQAECLRVKERAALPEISISHDNGAEQISSLIAALGASRAVAGHA